MLDDAGYATFAVIPAAYFDPNHWVSLTRGFQQVDASAVSAGKHNAREVTDAALRALSMSEQRPTYLWVHYYDAHSPYSLPPGLPDLHQTDEAIYEAELRFIDGEVGRLLAAVEARPEGAYVIVTADHATVFHPDPSTRVGHYGYDLYTATLHVPLTIRGPGIVPGAIDGVVSTMDIAPTITDLLRISDRARLEGTSLLPEMLAREHDASRVIFHELYLPERGFRGDDPLQLVSVRDDRWNLVLDRAQGGYELYDWTADYFERHGVYEDNSQLPEIQHLRSLLGAFVQQFYLRPPGSAVLTADGR
jgi:arylsulfatase A-like enzyme